MPKDPFYNKMLSKILEMLCDRIIAFKKDEVFDEETWFRHLNKIYKYMNILELNLVEKNKNLETKFTVHYEKLVSFYETQMPEDRDTNSTHTSNEFIKETKKEFNLNRFGAAGADLKSKKPKKGKARYKNKSNSKQRGNKSVKTIQNQPNEQNTENNDDKLASTLGNENQAFLAMSNTIPQSIGEENKVEVIETGDKGSAKITNPVSSPEKTPDVPNNVADSINDKSVISNPVPPLQIATGTFSHKDGEFENTEDRRSLTQEQNRDDDQDRTLRQKKLNTAEIVPPIQDPEAQVFPPSTMNILAKSRRTKKKRLMNRSHYNGKKTMSKAGMWAAFPGRKMKFSRKYTPSRGYSVHSGSSSRRRYKSSSRSSRSSRSGSLSKRYKSSRVKKMKRKYLRNILPHVGIQNKSKIVKKFTNPSN
ncbi:unnamed protein product [Moneuplotes crassus]|uniref:Uncharacterized protein n=1 Tax=Euplotes crassus TaxID=5936 RepID=A0AAD1XAE0_EUPCR|nr:unnamed protein product [Moneuplotes crassus]